MVDSAAMQGRRRILWIVPALVMLIACAKDYGVSTSFDPLTRFPTTATFAWDRRANVLPSDPRLAELNRDFDAEIRTVARGAFAERGYTETTAAANYRLSYQLDVKTWTGAEQSTAVGTLSLQLVESASRRRVWTGFARAHIHVGLEPAESTARLRQIVDDMLEDFPPKQRGN